LQIVNKYDILFLCETWLKDDDSINIEGYYSVSIPRPESNSSRRGHGGVFLLIKSKLLQGLTVCETDNSGVIWIKASKTVFDMKNDVYMCFVYIPPSNSFYYLSHDIGFF
jgi:hypothetical protein